MGVTCTRWRPYSSSAAMKKGEKGWTNPTRRKGRMVTTSRVLQSTGKAPPRHNTVTAGTSFAATLRAAVDGP